MQLKEPNLTQGAIMPHRGTWSHRRSALTGVLIEFSSAHRILSL
jgi:hypothetical protein